jgi:hypothetical protein
MSVSPPQFNIPLRWGGQKTNARLDIWIADILI